MKKCGDPSDRGKVRLLENGWPPIQEITSEGKKIRKVVDAASKVAEMGPKPQGDVLFEEISKDEPIRVRGTLPSIGRKSASCSHHRSTVRLFQIHAEASPLIFLNRAVLSGNMRMTLSDFCLIVHMGRRCRVQNQFPAVFCVLLPRRRTLLC